MFLHPPSNIQGESGSSGADSDIPRSVGGILGSASVWNECLSTGDSTLEFKHLNWNLVHRWLLKDFWHFSLTSVCSPQHACQTPIWSMKFCLQKSPSLFQVDTIFFPTSFPKVKFSSQACVVPKWGKWKSQMLIRTGSSSEQLCSITQSCLTTATFHMGRGRRNSWIGVLCSEIVLYRTSRHGYFGGF